MRCQCKDHCGELPAPLDGGRGTRHNSRIAACFLGTVGYWALTTYTGLSVTAVTTGTPFQTTQAGDSMAPAAELSEWESNE